MACESVHKDEQKKRIFVRPAISTRIFKTKWTNPKSSMTQVDLRCEKTSIAQVLSAGAGNTCNSPTKTKYNGLCRVLDFSQICRFMKPHAVVFRGFVRDLERDISTPAWRHLA